jgi:diaminopimelate epimerase
VAQLNERPFTKGHGTGNDFILLPDLDGIHDVTAEQVRWLCDRHRGIGADGVIRIVRSVHVPDVDVPVAEFFMDYRNSDGSVAEMCGNGARLFVRYLQATGLVDRQEIVFATRGGLRQAWMHTDRSVTIDMGRIQVLPDTVQVQLADQTWSAQKVFAPNPHAVAFVADLAEVGSLIEPPAVMPTELFPEGVNVEFVQVIGPTHVRMRVHERGVGETLSCGTGACAVAEVLRGRHPGDGEIQVDVPGGTVWIGVGVDGQALLRGPADLVARGTVLLPT